MKRLLVLIALVPFLIAAKPSDASCSVTPNPTAIQHEPGTSAYAYFTVNATGPQTFSLYVQEPAPGPLSTWGSFQNTATLSWQTPFAGQGNVRVMDVSHNKPRVLASCAFTVLP